MLTIARAHPHTHVVRRGEEQKYLDWEELKRGGKKKRIEGRSYSRATNHENRVSLSSLSNKHVRQGLNWASNGKDEGVQKHDDETKTKTS